MAPWQSGMHRSLSRGPPFHKVQQRKVQARTLLRQQHHRPRPTRKILLSCFGRTLHRAIAIVTNTWRAHALDNRSVKSKSTSWSAPLSRDHHHHSHHHHHHNHHHHHHHHNQLVVSMFHHPHRPHHHHHRYRHHNHHHHH